jgi:hypothetical protein
MVRFRALLLLLLLGGCTRSHTTEAGFTPEALEAGMEALGDCAEQMEASVEGHPVDLQCTGLYADMSKGKIASGIDTYEPAYHLWSDNSDKTRWIRLPKGEQIDTSDMNQWALPIGTHVWKEFRRDGAKMETRLYRKVRDDLWRKATFKWSKDQKRAERLDSGEVRAVKSGNYEIPPAGLCDDCHDGSPDAMLGFEAVSLGLPGADTGGLTLQKLVDRDLLSDPPAVTQYEIGDDGTGKVADVLGWLHINCGVTCHNAGVNSEAEITGLRMKLMVEQLDGRSSQDFEVLKQLLNVQAVTNQWQAQKRIVPGNADESLLYQLITTRIGKDSNKQMPPLLTRIVDDEHAEKVKQWILAMKPMAATSEE